MAKTALPSCLVSHRVTGCPPGRILSRILPCLVGRKLVRAHFHGVCVLPFLQLDHDVPVKCVCVVGGGKGGGKGGGEKGGGEKGGGEKGGGEKGGGEKGGGEKGGGEKGGRRREGGEGRGEKGGREDVESGLLPT